MIYTLSYLFICWWQSWESNANELNVASAFYLFFLPFHLFFFLSSCYFLQLNFIWKISKRQAANEEAPAPKMLRPKSKASVRVSVGGAKNNNGVDFISFLHFFNGGHHLFFRPLPYFVCLLVSSCLNINTLKIRWSTFSLFSTLLSFLISLLLTISAFRSAVSEIKRNSFSYFCLLHYLLAKQTFSSSRANSNELMTNL